LSDPGRLEGLTPDSAKWGRVGPPVAVWPRARPGRTLDAGKDAYRRGVLPVIPTPRGYAQE